MAQAGDRFEMPDGSVYVVRTPTAATGGDYVEMEFVLPKGCFAPPPHIHPRQVEEYQVIEGSFDVMVDGEWSTIGPGESASVPVGVTHTFANNTDETIRVMNWHRPAVDFEKFIERTSAALEKSGIKSGRDPRVPIYISTFFMQYPETLVPSRRRERIGMRAMAGIGRVFGIGRE
jgi:quercetin dioxygenase-like cupin family protein